MSGFSSSVATTRASMMRESIRPSRAFWAWMRRNAHWTLPAGVGVHMLYPNWPLVSLGLVTGLTLATKVSRSRHPLHGPFLRAFPGEAAPREVWNRMEGPPDKGGAGAWFLGNCMESGEECWYKDDTQRVHTLVFGTTGSGKTVALSGYMYQAIATGSGFIFCDGKADVKTWFDIFTMAGMNGRATDLKVLNFITGTGVEKLTNIYLRVKDIHDGMSPEERLDMLKAMAVERLDEDQDIIAQAAQADRANDLASVRSISAKVERSVTQLVRKAAGVACWYDKDGKFHADADASRAGTFAQDVREATRDLDVADIRQANPAIMDGDAFDRQMAVIRAQTKEKMEQVRRLLGEERAWLDSNTFNPFTVGNADTLNELFFSLMRQEEGGGDMWTGRMQSLVRAIMPAFVAMRDRGELIASVKTLRECFTLPRIGEIEARKDLPVESVEQLTGYLNELPGYREGMAASDEQTRAQYMEQADKQHGFLTMQLTEVFTLLSGTYGHIFSAEWGDIDFDDVVQNRRILYVMLPALEKSPESIASLGRICVAGIKAALSKALKAQLSGSKRDLVDTRPTTSEYALLAIMDEYGSYAVNGFGDVAAQARSLGVGVIFAGQDYPGFKKGSELEAARILSNTGIKIFLKTLDPETVEIAIKEAGKGVYLMGTGQEADSEMIVGEYRESANVSWREEDRLTSQDLRFLAEGHAYVIWGDRLIKVMMFGPYSGGFKFQSYMADQARHNVSLETGTIKRVPSWVGRGSQKGVALTPETREVDNLIDMARSGEILPQQAEMGGRMGLQQGLGADMSSVHEMLKVPGGAMLRARGMLSPDERMSGYKGNPCEPAPFLLQASEMVQDPEDAGAGDSPEVVAERRKLRVLQERVRREEIELQRAGALAEEIQRFLGRKASGTPNYPMWTQEAMDEEFVRLTEEAARERAASMAELEE